MPDNKNNWLFIFFVVFFAIISGGCVLLQYSYYLTEPTDSKSLIIKRISKPKLQSESLVPTDLDINFLNQVNKCFLPIAAVYGYELRITSGFRSLSEQDQIYSQGRTEDGHIVTWAPPGMSIHNFGFTVDVVDRLHGYNINWEKLAKIGNYCGLDQVDPPHFEYRGGLTTEQFMAGLKPAPLVLPCPIMDERVAMNDALSLNDLHNCGAPTF